MRYAIVSNPRDKIAPNLAPGGSVAVVSLQIALRLAADNDVLLIVGRGPGEPAETQVNPRLRIVRLRDRLSRWHKYREFAASVFERLSPHFLSDDYFDGFYAGAARVLKQFEPDVVHLQNYGQATRTLRAAAPRARIIVHLHDAGLAHVNAKTASRILGGADLVLTCSDYVAAALREAHPHLAAPMRPIRNGVDPAHFVFTQRAPEGRGSLRIAYIGRISPEKGVHVLVDAFERALRALPNAKLDIVGQPAMFSYEVVKMFHRDPHWAGIRGFYGHYAASRLVGLLRGPGARYLAGLVRGQSERAARATRWLGDLPHSEIANVLASADVLVVPSVCDEPFGIPAVEAMASGLPVIASDAGGLVGVVADQETGILVPRSDAQSLADAIVKLGEDPVGRIRLGSAGRLRAEALFSWDHVVANLRTALRELGT